MLLRNVVMEVTVSVKAAEARVRIMVVSRSGFERLNELRGSCENKTTYRGGLFLRHNL